MKRKRKINNILVHLFLSVLAIIWVSPCSGLSHKPMHRKALIPRPFFRKNIHLTIISNYLRIPEF